MKRVLDDLNIFCKVVEQGSLKGAAEALSVPHSTVSRRIDSLEQSLGLTLLHRSTREVKVSSRGLELYQGCASMLDSIKHSIDLAVDAEIEFKGSLKVSMPVKAGIDFLGSWLIDFACDHENLTLDISLSNDNKNLIQDDIDLALRVGPLVDSSAIAVKLWDIPYTLCATQSFLNMHQINEQRITISELEKLPCVVSRPAVKWAFINDSNQEIFVSPNVSMLVDDLGMALHAAKSGQLLAMLPTAMLSGHDDLVNITLLKLTPRTRVMYAYYLGRRYAQSQIKQVVDYVKNRYNSQ